MTISTTKKILGATIAAGVVFALAGCGQAPTESGSDGGAEVDSDFLPCLVSDAGGWNDKSFNQSAKEGMDAAAEELGVKPLEFESANDNDYAPNLETAVSEGCSFIVSVGFKLSAATVESDPAVSGPDGLRTMSTTATLTRTTAATAAATYILVRGMELSMGDLPRAGSDSYVSKTVHSSPSRPPLGGSEHPLPKIGYAFYSSVTERSS